MIGVGEGRGDDRPSARPGKALFIEQYPHELDDRDGRMRVVELDRDFIRKIIPRIRGITAMPANDVAQGTGDEKILLHKTELFAVFRFIVGIKDF